MMTHTFEADEAGVVSWVHLGDLHITGPNDESDQRLVALVRDLCDRFAGSIGFALLPGDIANEGTSAEYAVVRDRLAALPFPWVAIIGDHDVQQRTLAHVRRAMAPDPYYAFDAGHLRFLALNAFDVGDGDRPHDFELGEEQLAWVDRTLAQARREGRERIIFNHCYPTDLRRGGERLSELVHGHEVRIFEMGHTHYNELANDGRVLYVATRSTGQIEEGPVGFSVTSVDGNDVSWRFISLGEPLSVVITSPTDERLQRDDAAALPETQRALRVRAKVWSRSPVGVVASTPAGRSELVRVGASHIWEGVVPLDVRSGPESATLEVIASDGLGNTSRDAIRLNVGAMPRPERKKRDQDNALPAWPGHDLLGTQLGPNKHGHGW